LINWEEGELQQPALRRRRGAKLAGRIDVAGGACCFRSGWTLPNLLLSFEKRRLEPPP